MSLLPRRRVLAAALAVSATLAGLAVAPANADADRRTPGCPAADAWTAGTAAARTDRLPDAPALSAAQLATIDRDLARTLGARGLVPLTARRSARPAATHDVAVHVHVIDGDETRGPSRKRVLRQLRVLDGAYRAEQASAGARTPFRFHLASFERVRNERWRRAGVDSPAERQMRRALHVGGRAALNVYVARPVDEQGEGTLLGWSSTPWNFQRRPHLDGVTLHQGTLPGGSLDGYADGDTAVHEVGHWLGLLHTFEGGCDGPGDLVDDTPAEATPSTSCDPAKDTCAAPGRDPVRNFMDYALDTCMDRFSRGQVSRMTDNWLAYRTP